MRRYGNLVNLIFTFSPPYLHIDLTNYLALSLKIRFTMKEKLRVVVNIRISWLSCEYLGAHGF